MVSSNIALNAFAGRRVLITGHTGFKGSWLALWLTRLGAEVTGFSDAIPTDPSHFNELKLDLRDRAQAVVFAYETGFVQARSPSQQ